MAHYFFNIVDGVRIDDEEGQELPDLEAARAEAVKSARSIMADAIWTGRLPLDEEIEIADQKGQVLAIVAFAEAVYITRS